MSETSDLIFLEKVRSGLFRIDEQGRIWRGNKRAERLLRDGYLQVRVMVDLKRYQILARRLVYLWFKGPIPEGWVVSQLDGHKPNNQPDNLELCTQSEIQKRAYRLGLPRKHGERESTSKLSDLQVIEIRNLYSGGKYRLVDLAKIYGVAFTTISRIIRGESRAELQGLIDTRDHRLSGVRRYFVPGKFVSSACKHNEFPEPQP
jgi:hypothetical protein